MEGHFHMLFDDPESEHDGVRAVNHKNLDEAISEAKGISEELGNPIDVHFVCTWGCGQPHGLKADEVAKVKAVFPDLTDDVFTGNK